MRPSTAVVRGAAYLQRCGVEDARASAEVLLMSVIGTDRVGLYRRAGSLTGEERRRYRAALVRRGRGVPVQHLTGIQQFRRLRLVVRPAVFIPRPETEQLVDRAHLLLRGRKHPRILDVGTGTGAIGLSLGVECPGAEVVATDVSLAACELAAENARRLGLALDVRRGSLFEALRDTEAGSFDLVVSNPPYVRPADYDLLPAVVRADPKEALVEPPGFYRRLVSGSVRWLRPGGALVVEVGAGRGREVADLVRRWFREVRIERDLNGHDRVVWGR